MSVRRLDAVGEPVFGRPTAIVPTGSQATAQLLVMSLKLFKEEWFLDRESGLAAFDLGAGEPRVFGGSADAQFLESEVKRVILSVDGVSALLSFALAFDHETRRATVNAVVSDVYGELIPINTVFP